VLHWAVDSTYKASTKTGITWARIPAYVRAWSCVTLTVDPEPRLKMKAMAATTMSATVLTATLHWTRSRTSREHRVTRAYEGHHAIDHVRSSHRTCQLAYMR
jgi:hypothetical protein